MDADEATGPLPDPMKGPHEVYEPDESEEPVYTGASGDPDFDMSLELVIATFADEASAKAAYDELREAEKEEYILLVDAAVVNRDDENRLHIREEHDMGASTGALFGAGIGTILGFIGGPLGLLIGGAAGAAMGAAAAQGSDAGMFDERLKEFAEALKPGTSMVIVAVAHFWAGLAAAFLERAGGQLTTIPLTDEIARQLNLDEPAV
jgi:uncharacterized membrane protein